MGMTGVWGGTHWYPGRLIPTGHEYAFAFVLLTLLFFLWIAILTALRK
jgi:hypothetical protein